jgi:hypothetical protein
MITKIAITSSEHAAVRVVIALLIIRRRFLAA